ncbi:MAG: hypothetical protein WCP29_03425 [Acidobacteriota bacterium]
MSKFHADLDRRKFLRLSAAAGAAGLAGLVGARGLSAQQQGSGGLAGLPDGVGTTPFKRPLGAVDFLDRKEYIHNMEIVAHVDGASTAGGEPLMSMWARGAQRLLPVGRAGWMDVSNAAKPSVVAVKDGISGCVAYNTRLKKWLMVKTAAQPNTSPKPGEFPHGQFDEEFRKKIMSYDGLRGIRTYDITDPLSPRLLNEFSTGSTGQGSHMNFYDGGKYGYLEAGFTDQLRFDNSGRASSCGIMVVDLTDPEKVTEVSRWHFPGQMIGEEAEWKKNWWAGSQAAWSSNHGAVTVPKRVEDGGTVGYSGFGHYGMVIFNLADIKNPKPYSVARWDYETLDGIPYHTCYPILAPQGHRLHNMLIAIPEGHLPDCREPYKPQHLIDVSDPRNPRFIGQFPRPVPPADAPYSDFCFATGRFCTHNIQSWVAPGNSRPEITVTTWFNAGIRIHDISDPTRPKELAYFIPPHRGTAENYDSWFRGDAETVFVEWDRNLIWFGARSGAYCLTSPALGKPVLEPRAIKNWTAPHLNAGWDGSRA